MTSAKEKLVEKKIIERASKYPHCLKLVHFVLQDEELHEMQDYANIVSIKRLGFNDHGPVHMRQVAKNAMKMLQILNDAGIPTSLEQEEIGTFEDSLCAVFMAGIAHDLGMMAGRQAHEQMSVIFAAPIIDRGLNYLWPDNAKKRVMIKALTMESIVGHMTQKKIHSLEAGIILIADGCDMAKGRARIPLAMHNSPRMGDIHIYSANAIKRVGIHTGSNKPIRIDVEMTSEVGFFQIEEVLLPKVNSSPAKQYVEVYAGVEGEEAKCYL